MIAMKDFVLENKRARMRRIKADRCCFFCKTKQKKRFRFIHHGQFVVFCCVSCVSAFGRPRIQQLLEEIPIPQERTNFFYKREEPEELPTERFRSPFVRSHNKAMIKIGGEKNDGKQGKVFE